MYASAVPRRALKGRAVLGRVVLAGGAVELLLFVSLVAYGRPTFMNFISTPDTSSYVRIAEQLALQHTLASGPRTLGYPLFVTVGYAIGGGLYGPYLVIAMQLALNLLLTWLGWRLLERFAPETGLGVRAFATAFLFWAGLGMATFLMSDFLAAVLFAVFFYGVLCWRTPSLMVVSGASLALATLTRPTFTFVPLLLPGMAYLVRHISPRIMPRYIWAFAAFSIAATSLSVAYQYRSDRYFGPSPGLFLPIQEMLYYGTVKQRSSIDLETFKKQFEQEVEKRTGRELSALTSGEREDAAKEIFREQFAAFPLEITVNVLKNAVKYVFAPVESTVMRFAGMYASPSWYTSTLRPVVALVCLPVFVLSLVPPVGGPQSRKIYYLLMLGWLIYVIGLSALGTGSGERIRFPLLAFMLPVFAWNADALRQRWVVARLARQPIDTSTGDAQRAG